MVKLMLDAAGAAWGTLRNIIADVVRRALFPFTAKRAATIV